MSEFDYSDVLGGDDHGQGAGGLRKMLEDALAMNKKLVDELQSERRTNSVVTLLTEKGIDPAVKEIIPQDADAKEWLEKHGHLFGSKKGSDENHDQQPNPETNQQLQAEREQLEQLNGVQDTGSPSTVTLDAVEKLKSFNDADSLMKYINSGGVEG